ncbi:MULTISPECIES: alpha/beta fold hydrolase [unclassified Marichromatium]|uniref:alpha/beta fold hydrolase n=1 Tax=unclassified Marichromatium TaxID=2618417 RepID=UPI000F40EC5D|nr:alpha/beta fold hydrolase [Marichromatium sp. AB31]RNE90967.1 alpha/beta fold hydrolase [Marichromatium sp. AB31]
MSAPRRLLLHGFTGTAADWATRCAHDPEALAIDLPGHGAAPPPRGDFASTIAALLAQLPPSIDELIGYSLGGRVALGLLQGAPERFRRATLISAHPGLTDPVARARRRAADRRWIELLRTQGIGAFVDAWEQLPLFATQTRAAPAALTRQRAQRLAQDPEGLAAALAVLGLGEMPPTWRTLARHPGRVRWIVGADDAKFLGLARRVAMLRPRLQLHVIPGAGHNPLIEAPARLDALLDPR